MFTFTPNFGLGAGTVAVGHNGRHIGTVTAAGEGWAAWKHGPNFQAGARTEFATQAEAAEFLTTAEFVAERGPTNRVAIAAPAARKT